MVFEFVTDPAKEVYYTLKHMNHRQLILQTLSLSLIVTSALMIWKSLCLYTGSESPVVVVLSGSMEPAFERGDILFLHKEKRLTRMGEIIVFSIDGRQIPIVHRVIKTYTEKNKDNDDDDDDLGESSSRHDILTKGDNNFMDDIALYAPGQRWLNETHIMGRTVGYLPYVGRATILMNDYPLVKYGLIVILGLLVISGKE